MSVNYNNRLNRWGDWFSIRIKYWFIAFRWHRDLWGRFTSGLKRYFKSNESRKILPKIFFEMLQLCIHWRVVPYHYFIYDLYRKENKVIFNYLPETVLYYRWINQFNKQSFLLDDRLVFYSFCCIHNIETPRVLGIITNGKFQILSSQNIHGTTFIQDILGQNIYILKPIRYTSGGAGIKFVRYRQNEFVDVESNSSICFDKETVGSEYVLCELVINCRELQIFTDKFANVFRIYTFIGDDGIPQILYITFKYFVHGKYDVNTAGEYLVDFNWETGTLGNKTFDEEYRLINVLDAEYESVSISRNKVNELIRVAKKAALAFSTNRFVGWDIALTDTGPTILEGNSSPGIEYTQRLNKGFDKLIKICKK